jgi:hypothetical protein
LLTLKPPRQVIALVQQGKSKKEKEKRKLILHFFQLFFMVALFSLSVLVRNLALHQNNVELTVIIYNNFIFILF